jgi:hypothetical protein
MPGTFLRAFSKLQISFLFIARNASRTSQVQFPGIKPHDGLLSQDFFFHDYIALVVQLTFVPEGPVR